MQTLQKYLLKKNNSLNQNNIFDSQSISVTQNSIMNSSTSFDTQYHNNIQEGGNQTDLKKRTHYEVSNFINNDISRFENTEVESVSDSDSDTSVFLNNTAKHLNQLTGGNVELNTNASTEEFLDYVENKLNNNLTGGDINNILQDSFMKGINKGGYIDNDTITQQDILNRLRLYVNGNKKGGRGKDNEDEDDTYTDPEEEGKEVTDPDHEEGEDGKGEEGEENSVTSPTHNNTEDGDGDGDGYKKNHRGGRRKNNSSDSSSSSDEDNSSSDSSSSIEENSSSIKLKIKSKRPNGNSKINDDNLTDEEDDDSSDEDEDEEDESDKLFETKEKTKRSVNKTDHITVLGSEVDDDDDDEDDDDDDSSDSEDKSSDDKKTKHNNKKSDYNANSLSSIIISSSKESITPYMMSSDYSLHTDDINLISFSPENMKKNKKSKK